MHDAFFIEGFTPEDYKWFESNGEKKLVSLNEEVISEGKIPTEICLVLHGLFALTAKNGEHISMVGPGGIIGSITFMTESIATVSVVAIEPESVVFAIPRKIIFDRLAADLNFAVRFYRATAIFLSDHLKQMIDTLIADPKQRTQKIASPEILGPVPLFNDDKPDFNFIQQLLKTSPSIADYYHQLQKGEEGDNALQEREHNLSVATMSAKSIKLLGEIAISEGINDLDQRVINHPPSMSAAEKQAILPEFLIQKTITIMINNKFFLCSGIGDFKIHHHLLSQINNTLGLSKSIAYSYINPVIFTPEIELGLMRSMVSTFFAPNRITKLCLVSLITSPDNQKKDIAISLSPFESLVLPYKKFPQIVEKYAKLAYPYLPFTMMNSII